MAKSIYRIHIARLVARKQYLEISVGETVGLVYYATVVGGTQLEAAGAKKCSLKFKKTFLANFNFTVASLLVRPVVF